MMAVPGTFDLSVVYLTTGALPSKSLTLNTVSGPVWQGKVKKLL
jgi:hypothetical protein